MLEMMMKQFLGDFDMDAVKSQAQQFAQSYANLLQDVKIIKEQQAELLTLLTPATTAQAATVTDIQEDDNGQQYPTGNKA